MPRPPKVTPEVHARILELAHASASTREIADILADERVDLGSASVGRVLRLARLSGELDAAPAPSSEPPPKQAPVPRALPTKAEIRRNMTALKSVRPDDLAAIAIEDTNFLREQLSAMALDTSIPPTARLKALDLLDSVCGAMRDEAAVMQD